MYMQHMVLTILKILTLIKITYIYFYTYIVTKSTQYKALHTKQCFILLVTVYIYIYIYIYISNFT